MTEAPAPHPLDPCDPDQCYQTMMSERTALITARRESEDNLVKTIIQLASALIALMAGFITQTNMDLSDRSLVLLGIVLGFLGLAVISGLTEHFFASKAYEEQQKLVEQFYQKIIYEFAQPRSNTWVRRSQIAAFISFVLALISLGTFALVTAGDRNVQRQRVTTSATPSSAVQTIPRDTGSGQVGGAINAASPSAKEMTEEKSDEQE